jgi:DNA-binding transcriptional LysR family regulator
MKGSTVELRQLKYFVAVAEELHFRRAAERLYVAQPAVSEQIRKLEAELGVRVFDRDQRHVSLTNAGAAFLEEARRVLHLADSARAAARNAHLRATARLRIGYAGDALPPSVPCALRRLASAAPGLEVSLETGTAHQLIDAVRDGRLDAVIAGLPAPVSDLRTLSLGDEHLAAAMPATDARVDDPELGIEQLASSRLLVLPHQANPAFHNAVVSVYRDAGLSPTIVELPEPRVDLALLAVASGGGVALLSRSSRDRYASPGVRVVDVMTDEPMFEYALVTHPEDDRLATRALARALSRSIERAAIATHGPLTLAA